jgi:hypothetical protein
MTLFWLFVSAGCAVSGLLGFAAVRFGTRELLKEAAAAHPLEREIWARRAPTPAREIPRKDAAAPAPAREIPWPPQGRAPQAVAGDAGLGGPPATPAPARTPKPAAAPQPVPAPTGPRPQAAKLALWARQVKAGERKMSIATDGCRVTWNRTCKHGHPSWLVHLGYLKRHHLPRHTPR